MIFYDFEVFKYDWLVVFIDTTEQKETVIINNADELRDFYETHKHDIWVGFNNKHYDQYIFKAILLGIDPKYVNDKIIVDDLDGWQISKEFNKIYMINYDVFSTKSVGLKTLEGFMGSNIKETDVPFNLDRKLTQDEINETIKYCRHDVEETIKVFMLRIDAFNAMYGIINAFPDKVSIVDIGESSARITAKVLECNRKEYHDEFDFFFLPCLKISKYKAAVEWFESLKGNPNNMDPYLYYKQSFSMMVAGIPHTFGFGGLHGAPGIIETLKNGTVNVKAIPTHKVGSLYHVDVSNYYPSMLIAWDLVTRSATNDNYPNIYTIRKQLKTKQRNAKTKEEAKMYKKMQDPYKVMLNGLSGAMKDKKNAAYDPRNNNVMCINGQLMLLDLIEHLEAIDGFELIQSNTDGLIVRIPDTDEAFNQMDDICYEWESRCSSDKCSILLDTDQIHEIYQKDVNNYLWIDFDGGIECRGTYVKELNALDNDLPIVNQALVNYMVNKVPIEETISKCDDMIMFQKIVKLSGKYEYVSHNDIKYDYKCYRVFASNKQSDGKICKCRKGNNPAKFGNTPDRCFICNDDVTNMKVPPNLDKQWYVDLAMHRLHQFGE